MKDSQRLFTPKQRSALYWAANGKCEECGMDLDPHDWHADHTVPHSFGGKTDVINGRALCPACNLKKGDSMIYPYAQHLNSWPETLKLRQWQERFLERWLLLCDPNAGGQKDFLMAVVPAAGKTTASLKAAHEGLRRGWFGRIVVVVPSRNLVTQWVEEANSKGIDLQEVEDYGRGITEPKDAAGIVTTYQTVAANPDRFRKYTSTVETLVIGDEIHHCGEKDHLAWGVGMRVAFNHESTLRLVSSGTPFRTDNAEIPFVTYNEKSIEKEDGVLEIQRVARADFEYGYGDALRDGVVRDILFPTWDSRVSWRRAGQEFTHTFQDDLEGQLSSDRLRAALDLRGEWLPEVIKNAHERLMTIRQEEGHPNAGGLVICKDKDHADGVAKLIEKITGQYPIVAHSEIEDASDLIDKFRKSSAPWIVTVRMVSEGVDIKRLRVGIYATNYKTRLFFLQAIARTTRYDGTVPGLANDGQPVGQPAWFYVPDDPDLQEYMAQIMELCVHHISDDIQIDQDGLTKSPGGQLTFLEGFEFLDGVDAIETGHFYEERKWSPEDMGRALQIFNGIPAFDHVPAAAKALALERFQAELEPRQPLRTPPIREESVSIGTENTVPKRQDERDKLKKGCEKQTKRLVYLLFQINQPPRSSIGTPVFDYRKAIAIVTSKLNSRFGARNIGDGTNEELRERRELLAAWINDIVNGQWDSSRLL